MSKLSKWIHMRSLSMRRPCCPKILEGLHLSWKEKRYMWIFSNDVDFGDDDDDNDVDMMMKMMMMMMMMMFRRISTMYRSWSALPGVLMFRFQLTRLLWSTWSNNWTLTGNHIQTGTLWSFQGTAWGMVYGTDRRMISFYHT